MFRRLGMMTMGLAVLAATAPAAAQCGSWPGSCLPDYDMVYLEPHIANARQGDLLFTEASSGLFAALMGALGQTMSHSGVLIDDGVTVRHDTMDIDSVDQLRDDLSFIWNGSLLSIFGAGDGYGAFRLEASDLYYGQPGVCEMNPTGSTTCNGLQHDWGRTHTLLLRANASSRPVVAAVANASRSLDGYYRLYAYMDTTGQCGALGASGRSAGAGCMCSGLADAAGNAAGQNFVAPRAYTPTVVNAAAAAVYNQLYSDVRNMISDELGWWEWTIADSVERDAARGVADQVVNCFVEGNSVANCNQLDHNWIYNSTTAYATSPDDLMTQSSASGHYEPAVIAPQWTDGGWAQQATGSYRIGRTIDYDWSNSSYANACPSSWNGTDDGCDVGCQFVDPDCEIVPDYDWYGSSYEGACPTSWNGTDDGCDVGCQFNDPDCL